MENPVDMGSYSLVSLGTDVIISVPSPIVKSFKDTAGRPVNCSAKCCSTRTTAAIDVAHRDESASTCFKNKTLRHAIADVYASQGGQRHHPRGLDVTDPFYPSCTAASIASLCDFSLKRKANLTGGGFY